MSSQGSLFSGWMHRPFWQMSSVHSLSSSVHTPLGSGGYSQAPALHCINVQGLLSSMQSSSSTQGVSSAQIQVSEITVLPLTS